MNIHVRICPKIYYTLLHIHKHAYVYELDVYVNI